MMESRLSRSLSRTFLLHDGILAIKEPFANFFHDGILATKEPFHEFGISAITEPFTNFSFTRWNFGYHGAFHEFLFHTMEFWLSRSLSRISLSHDGILAIMKPFTKFTEFTNWGKTLFIYITKSIYIGSALLKTLPLDLEPLCKEKSMVFHIVTKLRKRKEMFLFPKSLIDL
jgi:hypothetical protein